MINERDNNLPQDIVTEITARQLSFSEKVKKISKEYDYEPIRNSLVMLTLTKDGAKKYGLQGFEEGHKYLYYLEGLGLEPFSGGKVLLSGNFIEDYEREPELAFPSSCLNYVPFGDDENIIAYSQPSEDNIKEFKTRLEVCTDLKLANKLMKEFFKIRQKCKPFMEEMIQNIDNNNIIRKN